MSDTGWVALAGFGGSVAVGVVAVWTTRSAQRGENARARANFQQQLNIERGKRLRELYEPFVSMHLVFNRIALEQGFTSDGEDEPSRNARHADLINDAVRKVAGVLGAVEVDPDTQGVKRLLHDTSNKGYIMFMHAVGPDAVAITEEMRKELEEMSTKVNDAIVAQLASLALPAVIVTGRRSKSLNG